MDFLFFWCSMGLRIDKGLLCPLWGEEESLDSFSGVKANGLPSQDEDEWNRKNVQQATGLAGVKSAKLYVERDQIGRRYFH